MPVRLEAIDARHPDTVALVRGPLVLFAMGTDLPALTRQELLAVKIAGSGVWTAGDVEMRPFSAIGRESYQTYFTVA
jgi:hypothetical protein